MKRILLVLFLLASPAFAVTPSEIGRMIDNGRYEQAQTALQDIVRSSQL